MGSFNFRMNSSSDPSFVDSRTSVYGENENPYILISSGDDRLLHIFPSCMNSYQFQRRVMHLQISRTDRNKSGCSPFFLRAIRSNTYGHMVRIIQFFQSDF